MSYCIRWQVLVERYGMNVKAKAGLNSEILKTSWGMHRQMLSYKAIYFVEIDPKYTSQTCSQYVLKKCLLNGHWEVAV